MAFQAFVTDLAGNVRRSVDEYESLTVTRRLNDFSEFKLELDIRESAAVDVLIAERALKLYQDGVLRFFGQVWEPFEMNAAVMSAPARDPLAGFGARRVRTSAPYTATDAGAIVSDRLSVQNGYRDTFLRMGAVDVSANRTITYDPGKPEGEILSELGAMADGFFYRVDALDGVPGKMGELVVLYPDAGTTRSEVRFGYGADTLANLADFRLVRLLPLTRLTAASQDTGGGRIAAAAENTDASAQYGLFEDELTYTDADDTTLLQSAADAGVKPTPPLTVELTPNVNAPLLFTDFDVGDFVRLNIDHGSLVLSTWVRVVEATLSIDKQGTAKLSSVTVETLSGARPNQDPSKLFRAQLDTNRRRIEALERRVQEITTTAAAPPPPPDDSSSGSGGSTTPPTDSAPPPPPPPPPPAPPDITGLSADGVNYRESDGSLRRGVVTTVSVDFHGLSGTVDIEVGGIHATLGGSGQVFHSLGPGSYGVNVVASTSAGSASGGTSATVPSVTAE